MENHPQILLKALELSATGIVLTDKDAKILWVNKLYLDVIGYSEEDVIGKTPNILKSGIHNKEFYTNMWQTIESGKVWKGEMVNVKKNGDRFIEKMSVTPILENNIRYYLAIKEDITELRYAEDELQRVFNLSPDVIVVADFNGKFIKVNPAWNKILGQPLDIPFLPLVHPDDIEKTKAVYNNLMNGETLTNFENRYLAIDGTYKNLIWSAVLVPEKKLIYAIARDVTEQRMSEKRILNYIKKAVTL